MLQIKVKKADNDLLIEQLHEVFRVLAADKMPVTKLDKCLDDVTHKWEEVKKLQPQVKSNVEPVQVRWGPKQCQQFHPKSIGRENAWLPCRPHQSQRQGCGQIVMCV